VRQRAVLRFWNREDMFENSREEVSDWMDEWYAENPDRLQAWEIWKARIGDDGMQNPTLITSTPPGKGFVVIQEITEKTFDPASIPKILKSLFRF
jgi:hypothetical protein